MAMSGQSATVGDTLDIVGSRVKARIPSGFVTNLFLILAMGLSFGALVADIQLLGTVTDVRRIAEGRRNVDFFEGRRLHESLVEAQSNLRIIAMLSVVCSIILAGALILWMYRTHRRLSAIGVEGLCHTSAGAVYWWFVPIANLVMPFLVMCDIWRGSGQRTPATGKSTSKRFRVSACVGIWWATWLGAVAIRAAAAAYGLIARPRGNILDDTTYTAIQTAIVFDIVGSVVSAMAAGLTILVIRDIVDRQQKPRFLRRRNFP